MSHWLEIIPPASFSELGDSVVPLRTKSDASIRAAWVDGKLIHRTRGVSLNSISEWVVDQEDPEGFMRSVRELSSLGQTEPFDDYLEEQAEARGYDDGDILILAILLGDCETTDADRLALATALAEVAP